MSRQRNAIPITQLPDDWPAAKRALETLLSQVVSPGVFAVHQIVLVEPIRAGAVQGAYLPPGTIYVDGTNTLRMVAAGEQWVMPSVVTSTGGFTAA